MADVESRYQQDLLIEVLADRLGFEMLSERLFDGAVYAPYLYFGVFILFDLIVLNTYKHFTGGTHVLLVTPAWLALPVGLLLGVFGIRYMSDNYARAMADLRVHDRPEDTDPTDFEEMLSLRSRILIYAIGVAVYFANLFVGIGIGEVIAYEGVVTTVVSYLFLQPFVYLPLVIEFALVYLSVHFVIPRRIKRANLGLFFYDPRNMGGFAPIGQLLKRSYYLYTAGLLLYFVFIYGPHLVSQLGSVPLPAPGAFIALLFSVAWLLGIASIAHSMIVIHRIMAAEKDERIRELEGELRDLIDNPYDINQSTITDEGELDDVRRRLEQVRSTRVYPATFTMWSQIGISVLLPQVLQFAVRTTM